jgi:hypothetical protein
LKRGAERRPILERRGSEPLSATTCTVSLGDPLREEACVLRRVERRSIAGRPFSLSSSAALMSAGLCAARADCSASRADSSAAGAENPNRSATPVASSATALSVLGF